MAPDKNRSIDWGTVRKQLQRSQIALEKGLAGDPRRVEEIYRKRAARLARPEASRAALPDGSFVLVFAVNSERYALKLEQVREVLAAPRITCVPGSPTELAGVINVRGRIEPVWETSSLLGLAPPAERASGYAVLLRRPGLPGALRVDRVLHVLPMRSEDWQQAEQPLSYVKGLSAEMTTLIEVEALLQHGGVG